MLSVRTANRASYYATGASSKGYMLAEASADVNVLYTSVLQSTLVIASMPDKLHHIPAQPCSKYGLVQC